MTPNRAIGSRRSFCHFRYRYVYRPDDFAYAVFYCSVRPHLFLRKCGASSVDHHPREC
jgi:hypothetical protein